MLVNLYITRECATVYKKSAVKPGLRQTVCEEYLLDLYTLVPLYYGLHIYQ